MNYVIILQQSYLKVKNDHRREFSNLSNCKEETWKNQGLTGFEPVTSAIPMRCSTNWATKRHIGMNYFIFSSHHFTPHGRYELNKLTSLPMYGFIAPLVEHRTGIAEVTCSNPVVTLIFFRLLLSNCLNWKIYCDDHYSLSSTTAVQIWIISYIYFTSELFEVQFTLKIQHITVLRPSNLNSRSAPDPQKILIPFPRGIHYEM